LQSALLVLNMPESLRHVICPLVDIPNPGALGFSPPGARFPDEWFLVRYDDLLRAYHNLCPHAGNFLNWKADAFLTRDKSLIMCSAHGALFDPASGVCGRAVPRADAAAAVNRGGREYGGGVFQSQ